ncbi:M28 family peptidase [Catalinimonas niigatensis]|uniref:M28 family peptidase n=1 Tax=Catalinimonas niigatensis TaxID=1397264 RepID=UPI0026655F55|nr:M28 family peptidase [Catalinimonas niigatensis]WPP48402.1 M28 family peptidase [Catalinimonas niigatensis]
MHVPLKLILLLLVLLSACSQEPEQTIDQESTDSRPEIVMPEFNADSAYHYIQQQVNFGPRVPNTEAHLATADFLVQKLEGYGADVQIQSFDASAFDGTSLALQNIIASINPGMSKRILLAAHWDSRPFADKDTQQQQNPIDGANDGGSGVGVLLELARLFQSQPPAVGVDIILFDGEDYGEPEGYEKSKESSNQVWWCLGSQYWAQNKHEKNYMAYYGILLDMVGAEGAQFYREGVSMRAAPSIVKKVWGKAHELGHGRHFIYENSPEIIDDHIYVNYNAKIPMIDIIEYAPGTEAYFPAYHHTHQDNMDIISKETLLAVGETVANVVYQE